VQRRQGNAGEVGHRDVHALTSSFGVDGWSFYSINRRNLMLKTSLRVLVLAVLAQAIAAGASMAPVNQSASASRGDGASAVVAKGKHAKKAHA